MAVHPRTPVIVGVGQYKQQLADVGDALEQYELMVEALRLAAADAGAPRLLTAVDRLLVIGGMWRYPDPGRLIADAVGAPDASTLLTAMGGNMPQTCVSDACERILAGLNDVVVVAGGEAVYSKNKLRKDGRDLGRTGYDLPAAEFFGTDVTMSSEHERSLGFVMPTVVYPLFESAVRAAAGRSLEGHREVIGELWADFNAVAVDNPYAWVRTPMTAEEIVTPSASNRMVGLPYTKSMNANSFVDFGGAIIVTSAEKAEALGVPSDRWVFPYSGTDGHATLLFSERDDFHSSPAIRLTGSKALELAGAGIDDIGHMDLYSCFPSVVQITMNELGIAPGTRVTTTGGLPFFGGPMNSYVIHAIASTVDAVRGDAGSLGFVHANGGYATKHACAVYGTAPPEQPFRRVDVQAAIDAYPGRDVDEAPSGDAVTESFTVLHGRDGPERALMTALMPDGRRALGGSTSREVIDAMSTEEFVGRPVRMSPDGTAAY
ncbi:MAG: acetyl-CoA acetyltransferase [Actinomycetota bacterium]